MTEPVPVRTSARAPRAPVWVRRQDEPRLTVRNPIRERRPAVFVRPLPPHAAPLEAWPVLDADE